MPVVKTTSPVTWPARADGVAVEALAVLEQDVGRHVPTTANAALPVGDGAGRDRGEHAARAASARAKQQFSERLS